MRDEDLALAMSFLGCSKDVDPSEVAGRKVESTVFVTVSQWREMFHEVNDCCEEKVPFSDVHFYASQILKIGGGCDYEKALDIAKQL